MFEKDEEMILYKRSIFTMEEELYKHYMAMRQVVNNIEKFKYGIDDVFESSEEFKQGFIAGVKVMSTMFMDI